MNSLDTPGTLGTLGTLIRWGKFNLVGAMGVVVQLAVLAGLHRLAPGHTLWATAAAVECALLHNFVWHLHYTWRDRRGVVKGSGSSVLAQLVRFHLANGLVSLLGNLALMRVLAGRAHMPLLAAKGIAIVCCSAANFCLGNCWAFRPVPQ